ncbi:hypothetical protein M885DRAFT_586224 [Pelagophyceae sp. CCMP2097]|nr:hypothetical protein M885DRAFT_586224 [Pelagophyceae sp. CCMP2097]
MAVVSAARRSSTGAAQEYRHGKSLVALGLFSASLGGLALCSPARFLALVNPLELRVGPFVALYAAKCAGLALLDAIVGAFLARTYATTKLAYRENTGAVGLEALEAIDALYLSINSVIEFVFAAHVIGLALAGVFPWRLAELSALNTLPALYLIFACDDALYAPTHRLMHWKPLYGFVHKHHHRQNLPVRGYLDAGNEHPIEQVLGLSCLWASLHIVSKLVGVHAVTILVHFVMYAMLALCNHTHYDLRFNFFGFEYTVGAHEMHHRYPQTNMAQYFMVWDKLMGTYRPYNDGLKKPAADAATQKKAI